MQRLAVTFFELLINKTLLCPFHPIFKGLKGFFIRFVFVKVRVKCLSELVKFRQIENAWANVVSVVTNVNVLLVCQCMQHVRKAVTTDGGDFVLQAHMSGFFSGILKQNVVNGK